jgi:hypothetical protein
MKRWYFCSTANLARLSGLVREHHFVDVSGGELVAVHFNGPAEMQAFEAIAGVTPLGHVVMNKTLPAAVVTALASYGAVSTDGLRDALVKVLTATKMFQLTLGEF